MIALAIVAASIAGIVPAQRVAEVKVIAVRVKLPRQAPSGWAPRLWPGDARVEDAWTLDARLFALVIGGDEADGKSALVTCRLDGTHCYGITAGPYSGLSGVIAPLGEVVLGSPGARFVAVAVRDQGKEFVQLCRGLGARWRCDGETWRTELTAERGALSFLDPRNVDGNSGTVAPLRTTLWWEDGRLSGEDNVSRSVGLPLKPFRYNPGCGAQPRSRFGRLPCD